MARKPAKPDEWDVEELKPPRELYIPLSMRARLLLLQAAFLALVILATNAVILHTTNTTSNQSEEKLPGSNEPSVIMLLREGFDSLDRWYVDGDVLVRNGSAILDISRPGSQASIDDGRGGRGNQWQCVGVEFELAFGGDEDEAFRAWGFLDTLPSHPRNFLGFVQYPPGSDESLVGFWAQVAVNNSLLHSSRVHGIDDGEFHNYTILWEPGNATFLIDGQVLLSTGDVPLIPMSIAALAAPWTYSAPQAAQGNVVMKTTIDVGKDAWIEIRELRVIASCDRLHDHAAEASLVLSSANGVIDLAEERGLDVRRILEDHAAAQMALADDQYVPAQLLSRMEAVAEILPEYLDELAELFPAARHVMEGDDPRARQIEAYYSFANAAWEEYDYPGSLSWLQKIMQLTEG